MDLADSTAFFSSIKMNYVTFLHTTLKAAEGMLGVQAAIEEYKILHGATTGNTQNRLADFSVRLFCPSFAHIYIYLIMC